MVADAAKPSISPKKSKGRGHAPEIDLLTRSRARNLYAVRQLGAQEVARQTGLSPNQVYSLAQREGWTKLRNQHKERELRESLAREERDVKEMVDAVAVKTQVLALGTLDEAIDELANGGEYKAKNLQALSVAAKNFNGIWREAKALNQVSGDASQGAQINVMFVGALPKSAPRNVTPDTASVCAPTSGSESAARPVIDVAPASGPQA